MRVATVFMPTFSPSPPTFPSTLVIVLPLLLLSLHPQQTVSVALRNANYGGKEHVCSKLKTCLSCLENSACGFCSHMDGKCMETTDSGASLHSCSSGWIVSPLSLSEVAQIDEAHTCSVLDTGKKRTQKAEELFVEGELLGLVSRACIPCRGNWPMCKCDGVKLPSQQNTTQSTSPT